MLFNSLPTVILNKLHKTKIQAAKLKVVLKDIQIF